MIHAAHPDGSVNIEPMLRSVDQRAEFIRHVEAEWRTHRLPIAAAATAFDKTIVETVSHLANVRGLRMWCCGGSISELEAAALAVAEAKEIVLDATALATLFLSGAFKYVSTGPVTLIASAGAVAEYHQLSTELQAVPESLVAGISKQNGRYVWTEPDPESHRRARQELDSFIAWIASTIRVEDGLCVAKLSPESRRRLDDGSARIVMEAMMLTREQAGRILWIDDMPLAAKASTGMVLPVAWSQVVLDHLVAQGQASVAAVDDVAAWLLRAEHFFIRVAPESFIRAGEQAGWNPVKEPLRTVLRVFGVRETEVVGMSAFTARTLRACWQNASTSSHAADVTEGILDHLALLPAGFALISSLRRNLLHVFWPDAGKAVQAELAFSRWSIRRLKIREI